MKICEEVSGRITNISVCNLNVTNKSLGNFKYTRIH